MGTLLLAAVATLVFCAPGYPGGAGDAQPFVDQFATATAAMAGWPSASLVALYDPSEKGGLAKLDNPDAVLAFVPYPFFVQYADRLHLAPLAQAQVTDVGSQERWSLVAKADAVPNQASLAGYTILSVAGYAPDFVRHAALGQWGLPPDVKIEATGQILSALRRVASGEHVLALLDQTQAKALPSLPFAAGLKTVTQSPPVPVAIVAVVDARLSPPRARAVQEGLLKMGRAAAEADTLRQLHLQGFTLPQVPARTTTP